MTEFGVHSEVGKLRKVMVHRPDLSLQRLTPTNHDELLFDEIAGEMDALLLVQLVRNRELHLAGKLRVLALLPCLDFVP